LGLERVAKIIKHRAFNKKVGPGKKNPKLINVGPTSFPEFEVINKNIIIQIGKIHWTLETCWKS